MTQPVGPADWSFFDQIYCISLHDRQDRRHRARLAFHQVGLAERVQFVLVKPHPTNSEQGIYESHLQCIRQGLAANAGTILIFEDDVNFERFNAARLAQCVEYLRQHDDWKVLFLGCLVKASRATANAAIRKVVYRCLSHAYALHRPYARQLLDTPWPDSPYDAVLGHFDQNWDGAYACYPSFAFQNDAISDNLNCSRLDRFRRRIGGLRRIQMIDEWYHRHKWWIVALHLLIPGAVLWLLFWK